MAKAEMHDLEIELRRKTGVTPKSKEDRQSFLKRLVSKVQDLNNDDWESLSVDAQKWANDAAKANDNEKEIEDFPMASKSTESKDKDEVEDDDKPTKKAAKKDDDKPTKKAAKKDDDKPTKKAAKKDDDKPAKKADKADGASKVSGVKVRIKTMLIKNPNATVDDIVNSLTKSGGAPSRFTVAGIRSEFRHSLKVLSQSGHLSGIDEI